MCRCGLTARVYTVYEVDGSDTDEEVDLLNFDDLDSDEFV